MKFLSVAAIFLATLYSLSFDASAQGVIATLPAEPITDWSQEAFWETSSGSPASQSWDFVDGEIRLARPRGGSGDLVTPALPPNFQLSWQWKLTEGTNTGLKYRVRRFGKSLFNNKRLGIEYQIIDDKPDSKSKGSTASIYDLVAPAKKESLKPVGQWNQARVVAVGDRIEHYLNGQLVTAATTSGPNWDAAIAMSKFYGTKEFGLPKDSDRILLTDHGGKAAFKDFQFKELDAPKPKIEVATTQAPFLGNAIRNSWADQDSIVIWTRTTSQPNMTLDGPNFIPLSRKEASQLAKESNERKLMKAQIPAGVQLNEMFGACPGAVGQVRLSYFPLPKRKPILHTDWVTTKAETDFTAQWKIEGLKAGTQYAAVVQARGIESEDLTAVFRGSFRTAPEAKKIAQKKKPKNVQFCITTCHDFLRRDDGNDGHKIYPAMTEIDPDFVVHAGDIEYYDKPDPWAMTKPLMRFKWQRIFALPSNRAFYANTTSYFLKDDHDTLMNDCWAGQTYGSVSFEEGVQLFNEEQFPSLSPRYKTVKWGQDLQIWFLEGRDYRSSNKMPDGPKKTILGEQQKAWLFRTLAESTSKFKLVMSPTPIVGPDRTNKSDNHANEVFEHEGREMREKLAAIQGVVVFCGDRHWQYASVDEKTGLWEFGCGPGSEKHQLGWKVGDERPTHRFLRVKGGFLSGHLTYPSPQKQPRLTIRHHGVTGKHESKFVFPARTQNDADPTSKTTPARNDRTPIDPAPKTASQRQSETTNDTN
jgi:alkaline phosphatase D